MYGPCFILAQGYGEIAAEGKQCNTCGGSRVRREKVRKDLVLPAGVPNGYRHVLESQGNEAPLHPPGDVVLVFNTKPHKNHEPPPAKDKATEETDDDDDKEDDKQCEQETPAQ